MNAHVLDAANLKREAAARALEAVRPGMRLGLGTGSTAREFVSLLGEKVAAGLDVVCVPTSEATHAQAKALGIKLTTLDETPELDLTIDGADEFDAALRLIKGAGGALLREKIVAAASKRMIVIADESKEVEALGAFPLPVEVDRFGLEATRRALVAAAGRCGARGEIALRKSAAGEVYVTDGGHFIFDCAFKRIDAPDALAAALDAVPGIVGHGLFIGLATTIVVAAASGVRLIGQPI